MRERRLVPGSFKPYNKHYEQKDCFLERIVAELFDSGIGSGSENGPCRV